MREHEFKAVVSDELDALFRTAWRMLRDRDEAEDAVQDALDKAWRHLGQLDRGSRLKPWLFSILTNRCRDLLRSRSGRQQDSFDEDLHGASDDETTRPDHVVGNRQLGHLIDDQIERLPPDHQDVVQLVIVEGFSYQDASSVLGVPVGTVRSRLSRARASLGEALKALLDDQDADEADRGGKGQNATRLRVIK